MWRLFCIHDVVRIVPSSSGNGFWHGSVSSHIIEVSSTPKHLFPDLKSIINRIFTIFSYKIPNLLCFQRHTRFERLAYPLDFVAAVKTYAVLQSSNAFVPILMKRK